MRLYSLPCRRGAVHPPRRALPLSCQQLSEALRFHLLHTRISEHYDIQPAEAFDVVAEALPDLTFQSMTIHGARHDATRNGESESGMVHAVGTHDERHDPCGQPDTTGKYLRAPARKSLRRRSRRSGPNRRSEDPPRPPLRTQAESLVRPFARRALRIRRPALVAIRARKP